MMAYNRCSMYDGGSGSSSSSSSALGHRTKPNNNRAEEPTEDIDCYINQEYSIGCRKIYDEIYLPFSFLAKYFEVYGSLSVVDGESRFDWSHSYGKVNFPKATYNPRGVFMYFENYNVEMRDRVKCISAAEGVPVSSQWESLGYFYPTQIAQFGLAHYSRNLTEPEPRRKVIEDGDKVLANWTTPQNSSVTVSRLGPTNVVHFQTGNSLDSAVFVDLDHALDLVLSVNLFMHGNATMMVTVQHRESKHDYFIHYIHNDLFVTAQDDNIYYGLGVSGSGKSGARERRLTRDLLVDLQKGIQAQGESKLKKKLKRTDIRVTKIAFLGSGWFDNLTLSTTDHMAHFYDAAEWFVRHQNADGGWPNPVKRKLGTAFAELASGWLSAMGQGHAISVLVRAYSHSNGDHRYLKAAIDGAKPFYTPVEEGGVLRHFMDKYTWFEEYPTTPPSFVLNGFIYSLLGLYDLNATVPVSARHQVGSFLEQGMNSLKKMLPLFDTGSGTSYDLRHFTLGVAPNLARWDYHATHVNQLLLLATIDKSAIFEQTAKRWQDYMTGKRAPHN